MIKRFLSNKIFYISLIFVIVLSLGGFNLFSQFIVDEEEETTSDDKNITQNYKPRGSNLPPHIAYNIKAENEPGIKHAIRITWSVHPEFQGEFLVGRSKKVVNSELKALNARFIEIVDAGSEPSVLDERLFPGEYYYVILAKQRVRDRKIDLVRDENYTSQPVIIGTAKDTKVVKEERPPVMIKVVKIADRKVMITWNRELKKKYMYKVYRNTKPIDNIIKFKNSEHLFTTTDSSMHIDKKLFSDGKYYYAITATKLGKEEDMEFDPNDTYTTYGIFIGEGDPLPVYNIKAEGLGQNSKITWDSVVTKYNTSIKEFTVYRAGNEINNFDKLKNSWKIGTINAKFTKFIDVDPGDGRYFYAVTTTLMDGAEDWRLQKDQNYTSNPVEIGSHYTVRSIDARIVNNMVEVMWSFSGTKGEKYFRLFRVDRRIWDVSELRYVDYVRRANVTRGSFIDEDPPAGKLYYGLVPIQAEVDKNFRIIVGVNITGRALNLKTALATCEDGSSGNCQVKKPGPGKEDCKADFSNVDLVLKRTFFSNKFHQAVKELQYLIDYSENRPEIAKAKLFVGRSYIELKRYSRALDFLVLPDVKEFFPKEAKFWSEHAMLHVRD